MLHHLKKRGIPISGGRKAHCWNGKTLLSGYSGTKWFIQDTGLPLLATAANNKSPRLAAKEKISIIVKIHHTNKTKKKKKKWCIEKLVKKEDWKHKSWKENEHLLNKNNGQSANSSDDKSRINAIITLAFPPSQSKENMKLATIFPKNINEERRALLDKTLKKREEVQVSCRQFKGRTSGSINEGDVTSAPQRKMRAKLFKFCESRRPPYWITFRRPGQFVGGVGPRRPFGIEPFMDYEVDSDDEWEREGELSEGELLTEDEEIEPADDYEVDNEFLVPHGYLSDGEKDDDGKYLSPSSVKQLLKMKEEAFKEEISHLKPWLIGCCWEDSKSQAESNDFKVLKLYEAVPLVAAFPVPVLLSELTGPVKAVGAPKRFVHETDIPILIRQIHGATCGKDAIVNEFFAHLKRTRPEDQNVPSKLQIRTKIEEIASKNWMVAPEVLKRYQLADLSSVNSWEYITIEAKKRKLNKEEENSPPSKQPIGEGEGGPQAKTVKVKYAHELQSIKETTKVEMSAQPLQTSNVASQPKCNRDQNVYPPLTISPVDLSCYPAPCFEFSENETSMHSSIKNSAIKREKSKRSRHMVIHRKIRRVRCPTWTVSEVPQKKRRSLHQINSFNLSGTHWQKSFLKVGS